MITSLVIEMVAHTMRVSHSMSFLAYKCIITFFCSIFKGVSRSGWYYIRLIFIKHRAIFWSLLQYDVDKKAWFLSPEEGIKKTGYPSSPNRGILSFAWNDSINL